MSGLFDRFVRLTAGRPRGGPFVRQAARGHTRGSGVRLLLFAAAVTTALIASTPAAPAEPAQVATAQEGRIVRGIEVIIPSGEKSPLEEFVINQMATKVGEKFSAATANRDIRTIYNLESYGQKQFDKVEIGCRDAPPDGVIVYVIVVPRVKIKMVQFWGRKSIDEEDLLKAVTQKPGNLLSRALIHRDIRDIEELYRKEGYPFVGVQHREELAELEQGIVVYEIEEGPRVSIDEIRFRGNRSFTEGKLRDQMLKTTESSLFSKGRFSREALDQDLEAVARFYRSAGFLGAVAEVESIDYSADKSSMVIAIHVREGFRYRVGRITFAGNRYFSDDELRSRLTLREGGDFNGNDFYADTSAIRRLYGDDAFLDVRIGPEDSGPQLKFELDEPVVDIRYDIVEGNEVYVGNIRIVGNRYTREYVIRNALLVHPGRKFNATAVEKSRERLIRTRLFDDVDIKIEKRVEKTRMVHDVTVKVVESDATVSVKEKEKYGTVQVGGGLSSDGGVLGFVAFTLDNFDASKFPGSWADLWEGRAFRGAGQRLAVTLSPGLDKISNYKVDFSDPYFFGSRYEFGSSLYLYNRQWNKYDEGRGGTSLSLRERLDDDLSLGYGFRFVNVDISSVDAAAPPDVLKEKGSSLVGAPRISLIKDTRRFQNALLPYEGTEASADLELSSALFASDFDFIRLSPGIEHYTTLYTNPYGFKHILKSSVSLGIAKDLVGGVPFFERFYAGGTSFRGFEFRGVGPHQSGEPVGAQTSVLGTFEYSYPILEDTLRGVVFLDYGTLDRDPLSIGAPRASVGLGIRLFSPQLPIPLAIDLGFPILKKGEDETQVITFSLARIFSW